MFTEFKNKLRQQVDKLVATGKLYETEVDKESIWNTYLLSFPQEERQRFNCNACKQYLRAFGNVVAIDENLNLLTMWDIDGLDPMYSVVAANLHLLVKKSKIVQPFFSEFQKIGVDHNHETLENGKVIRWEHMSYVLPRHFVRKDIASHVGTLRATKEVTESSMEKITMDAIDTVLELIASNNLYRGEEFKGNLLSFKQAKTNYLEYVNESQKDRWLWSRLNPSLAIKNTVIGTLLVDLSNGVDLERAVASFESKVAPTNYKRPAAVVTQRMIQDAEKTLLELGLSDALNRRKATKHDITANNILFVDHEVKSDLGILGHIKSSAKSKPIAISNVDTISLDMLVKEILPLSESVEVLFQANHISNLVSLVAPVNTHSKGLFKWDNGFSWSYNNGVADSMKEKVKNAGGRVDGKLRVSLEWFNYDDLDLHLHGNGDHIYYYDKHSDILRATLDVDMNAGELRSRTPVENIIFSDDAKIPSKFIVSVHQYSKRESVDVGYNLELEYDGNIIRYENNKSPVTKDDYTFSFENGILVPYKKPTSLSERKMTVWGLDTTQYHKVSCVMYSPNYWDEQQGRGNRHVFFMLQGAKNDTGVRGMFNEFLKPELETHKRVFEIIGAKTPVQEVNEELSGLGFSTTKQDEFIVRVTGKLSRVFKVKV